MAKIFEVDFRQGSFKDRVSGTIPTNTGVVISQQEKGRSIKTDDSKYLEYDLDIYTAAFGMACIVNPKATVGNVGGVLSFTGSDGERNELSLASNFQCRFVTGTPREQYRSTSTITKNKSHLLLVDFDGVTTRNLYIDNVSDTLIFFNSGSTSGADTVVRFGSLGYLTIPLTYFLDGFIAWGYIQDAPFTAAERTKLYNDFLASTHITKPIIIKRSTNVASLDGATYAKKSIANFRSTDTAGSIEADFRTSSVAAQRIFSTADESAPTRYLQLLTVSGRIYFAQRNNDTQDLMATTVNVHDNKWHHVKLSSDGGSYTIELDGVELEITVAGGANSGDWFAETEERDNIAIGASVRDSVIQYWNGEISDVVVRDADGVIVGRWQLNEAGGPTALDSSGNANHMSWEGTNWSASSNKNMIVSLEGTNWNADGGTTNRSLGNLEIATGAFRCLEDATGKYIECTTGGTLTLSGIDLSIFTGNGYLKEVVGDLSGDQGGTVDAASAFAFSSNVLTVTMTAAQKLRGLVITSGA